MSRNSPIKLGVTGVLTLTLTAVVATSAVAYDHGAHLGFGATFYGHAAGHRVCKPVVKKVKWFDGKGQRHWTRKVVDRRCWWEPGYRSGTHDYPSLYRIGPGKRWLGGW